MLEVGGSLDQRVDEARLVGCSSVVVVVVLSVKLAARCYC